MITQIVTEQMHPVDIQACLKKGGFSQASIAKELKVAESSVHNVIKGTITSRRIAEHIANKIGKSIDEIWPNRYQTDQAA